MAGHLWWVSPLQSPFHLLYIFIYLSPYFSVSSFIFPLLYSGQLRLLFTSVIRFDHGLLSLLLSHSSIARNIESSFHELFFSCIYSPLFVLLPVSFVVLTVYINIDRIIHLHLDFFLIFYPLIALFTLSILFFNFSFSFSISCYYYA